MADDNQSPFPADLTPPASQHHYGFTDIKTKVDDLNRNQKQSCDDLIVRLGDANGTAEKPNENTRDGLWKVVFDGWDTNCPNTYPGSIRDRRAVESMLEVGTWAVDLPANTGTKKQTGATTNPVRKAGRKAFIKPSVNWDAFGVSFNACDENRSNANAKFITLKPGWSLQQARAEAMVHWDRNETKRVQGYNTELVICLARSRLLTLMRALHIGASAAGTRPVGTENEILENGDELIKLVTCEKKIQEVAALAAECSAIVRARPSRNITLARQKPSHLYGTHPLC